MTQACSCNLTHGNFGTPDRNCIADQITHAFLMPYFAANGSINKLDLATDWTAAFFSALVNQVDPYSRLFPFGRKIESAKNERGEPIYHEYESGTKIFTQDATRVFSGVLPKTPFGIIKAIESHRCSDMGVFYMTKNGQFIGNMSEWGYLRPFRLAKETLHSYAKFADDKVPQEIMIRWEIDQSENDGDIGGVELSEMETDPRILVGLKDAYGVVTSVTATGLVATIFTLYGSAKNRVMVSGLVIGDFDLTNLTDDAAITITSVAEGADGVYTFVIPSQTSADRLKLEFTKAGYDDEPLSKVDIDIP